MTTTKFRRLGVRRVAPLTDESGATAVEYALMASLITGVISVAVATFGQAVLGLFQSVPVPFG
jgi:Flp pilus assembly pilin Flp